MATLQEAITAGTKKLAGLGAFHKDTGELLFEAHVNPDAPVPASLTGTVTLDATVPLDPLRVLVISASAEFPKKVRPVEVWEDWSA